MSLFLHQTTTGIREDRAADGLYMSLFLHQTTTKIGRYSAPRELYMSLFLHQTTTAARGVHALFCCICLYSYIKPQQAFVLVGLLWVVYVSIPTSNHNAAPILDYNASGCICLYSYIKPQLFSTFLILYISCICLYSYIKPQPSSFKRFSMLSCICLYSYIKPQLIW